MPLKTPRIEQASYDQILDEALARIPVHTAEWTNWNDTDPGVTMLQLFAFMTENLLYRSNRIPERNRIAFLKLLDIPLQPAEAARGLVRFLNTRGPLEAVTLSRELELRAGSVPYHTLDALDVLPVEGKVFYKKSISEDTPEGSRLTQYYRYLYEPEAANSELVFYKTTELEPPKDPSTIEQIDLGDADTVVDAALWIALLARSAGDVDATRAKLADRELSLGIFPALGADRRTIRPDRTSREDSQPALLFDVATGRFEADGRPRYERLPASVEGAGVLQDPSVVKLRLPGARLIDVWRAQEPKEEGTGLLPPALERPEDQRRLVTWLRIRLPVQQAAAGLSARLNHVCINAARIAQRARVADEYLGGGTGEADQVLQLANAPVISGSVELTVGGESWSEVPDLSTAPPEIPRRHDLARRLGPDEGGPPNVFALDREAGRISFGNGLRGARPPAGVPIRASYAHGGGPQGNVGIGAVSTGPDLPAGMIVGNTMPTWGGDAPETAEEGERQVSNRLRHRNRLVSEEDFRDIALQTPGVDLARVEILSLFNPDLPDVPAPGAVTVMVIPRTGGGRSGAPKPDRRMVDLVCEHLAPKRLVTTELHVRGPSYRDIVVSAGVKTVAGRDFPAVRQAVERAIRRFLSPVEGGHEGRGWPLDKPVVAKELWAEAARVDGVSYVVDLLIAESGEENSAPSDIDMNDLELPKLAAISVTEGDPESIEDLATGTKGGSQSQNVVPVPVVPPEC